MRGENARGVWGGGGGGAEDYMHYTHVQAQQCFVSLFLQQPPCSACELPISQLTPTTTHQVVHHTIYLCGFNEGSANSGWDTQYATTRWD